MRISNRMLSRNYVRVLQDNTYRVANSHRQITTNQKYLNMSDNVADCARSLRADQQVQNLTRQMKGIEFALGGLDAADDSLQGISDVFTQAYGELTNAVNLLGSNSETIDKTKLAAMANVINSRKEEILQLSNTQYSGKYQFSGTSSAEPPFKYDAENGLTYNGAKVDEIYKNEVTGELCHKVQARDEDGNLQFEADGVTPVMVEKVIPRDEEIYLDVGRGIQLKANEVDPATAFQISFSGLGMLGYGTTRDDETGIEMSNNLYGLLDQVETTLNKLAGRTGLEEGETVEDLTKELYSLYGHVKDRHDSVINTLTDLGGRVTFLENITTRLTDQVGTLENLKLSLVGVDTTDGAAAKELADHMYAYNATLQLGASMFQTSLLDFLKV